MYKSETKLKRTLTGVFEQVQGWYISYAQELPGVNAQERTLEEAHEMREAIQLSFYLIVN